MCTSFHCRSCDNDFFNRCTECLIESKSHCGKLVPIPCSICDPCEQVTGAIALLEDLVYKAPFLVEKGLSGLEELEEWERPHFEDLLLKKRRQWKSEVESVAEKVELDGKLKAMDLGGMEDARDDKEDVEASNELDDDEKENEDPVGRMRARFDMNKALLRQKANGMKDE